MSKAAKKLQSIGRIPNPVSAYCSTFVEDISNGGRRATVHTTWSTRDFVRLEKNNLSKSHTVYWNPNSRKLSSFQNGIPVENANEKAVTYSADGKLKAVFTKFNPKGKKTSDEKEAIEVYTNMGKIATNDLEAMKKHGQFYSDGEMGGFHFTPSEGAARLLYVAEEYQPKPESWFTVNPSDPENANKAFGIEFLHRDDWGEQLQKKCQPALCVLDWKSNTISVLENVPKRISPGQPVWTPDGTGVVFVGFDHSPEKLGMIYCPIRKSRLYHMSLESKTVQPLTPEGIAVRCPRFSPDGKTMVFVQTPVGGPHMRAMTLMKISWGPSPSAAVPVVPVPSGSIGLEEFPGLYTASLPKRCFSADSKRVILSSVWRSTQQILCINVENGGEITCLTRTKAQELPKWEVLDVSGDFIVASASSPNSSPSVYVAWLPESGNEESIEWVPLDKEGQEDGDDLQKISWGIERIPVPETELDVEAIWIKPSNATNCPLILWPHGGPHSAIVPGFDMFVAALAALNYAVVFVNYRGSIGFGEQNLVSLLGKIGRNDVDDCMLALDHVLNKWQLTRNDLDIFVQGGSHGGFLGAHLIGQFPDVFKACALRNPVINIASMFASTDIKDWAYVECGVEYSYDKPPIIPPFEQLLAKSPILHASKVTCPTLILIGEKDRRVPPQQGIEFYRALSLAGIPTKLLRYPDSDHPISEIDAEGDWFIQMVNWFSEYSGHKGNA